MKRRLIIRRLKSLLYRREKDKAHLTLGKLVALLRDMPDGAEVANLVYPHSYRGRYEDIAFELGEGTRSAVGLLKECSNAIGGTFYAYRGDEYVMGEQTLVCVANYGKSGRKLLAVHAGGLLETSLDE